MSFQFPSFGSYLSQTTNRHLFYCSVPHKRGVLQQNNTEEAANSEHQQMDSVCSHFLFWFKLLFSRYRRILKLTLTVCNKVCSCCDAARTMNMTSQKLIDIDNYLKRMNKTPVKTIESPDGDTIDCVDVYKQPAFDHPLLKNHKIQMRPNYYPNGFFPDEKLSKNTTFEGGNTEDSEADVFQPWHKIGRCPEGTIPIRRITREDLLRAGSVERFRMKWPAGSIPRSKSSTNISSTPQSLYLHEHAVGVIEGGKYYGVEASFNVWQPTVQVLGEFSLSQLWLVGREGDVNTNTIEVGWQVFPKKYGDNRARLFVFWTRDNYRSTGCYNLDCSGFIQVNKEVQIGGMITPISSYKGKQLVVTLFVWKEPKDGNWWLQFNNIRLGYWPASLFTHLQAEPATSIHLGGEILNARFQEMHTRTQMGSGHFPKEGNGKACYIRNIQIVDASNNIADPGNLVKACTRPDCYDVDVVNGVAAGGTWGKYLYHGGPGRTNENCQH